MTESVSIVPVPNHEAARPKLLVKAAAAIAASASLFSMAGCAQFETASAADDTTGFSKILDGADGAAASKQATPICNTRPTFVADKAPYKNSDKQLDKKIKAMALDVQYGYVCKDPRVKGDTQYYDAKTGKYHNGGPYDQPSSYGPAVLDAYIGVHYDQPDARHRATVAVTTALHDNLQATGLMGSKDKPDTQFNLNIVSDAYLELKDSLDPGTKRYWKNSIRLMANYMEGGGHLAYYPNGNIKIDEANAFEKAYLATGDKKYRTDSENTINVAMHPDPKRWPNHGLLILKKGKKADGSDSKCALSESGTYGKNGVDWVYTMFQSAIESDLYMRSIHEKKIHAQAEFLLNCTANFLNDPPRLRDGGNSYYLIGTDGTRRHQNLDLFTSAYLNLARKGGRKELRPLAGRWLSHGLFVAEVNASMHETGNPLAERSAALDVRDLLELTR